MVNSNGVCFFFKKAQCILGINFPGFLKQHSLGFTKGSIVFSGGIIPALWKGGRLEKCLNWCLDITYFRFVFYRFFDRMVLTGH